ncbi:MAG TPA: DUF2892 domain-containing protein [Candidatus Moranbacteria bacterium]|nr:DUF2892 domain-containing protein [Candidatus Moranbacteria bacterium]
MPTNESGLDRTIRALLGMIIVYLAYASFTGIWQVAAYVIGIILLFTAVTGFCMLYKLLGISTKK